jgi:lipoprotein-anchoring transpeptidase ErfK/SrfK
MMKSTLPALFLAAAITVSADPPAAPAPLDPPASLIPKAPEPVESILRLQIYLDGKLFCPGKVDGRPGEFTTKALNRHQSANGMPLTGLDSHQLDLSEIAELYTTYTIRQEDLKFIGEVPSKPSLQSQKKYLPYASLLEFLTERFHTSPELIEWLNQPRKMNALKPGDEVRVPNVMEPFQIELLEPVASLPEIPGFKDSRVIRIDTREKLLGVYEGERLLASMPITPGSGHNATPPGAWRIVGITQMPTFRWDEGVLNYGVRTSTAFNLPIGPNNPVGVMWIGLSKPGIGIHGTNSPQTIGRSSSHGCMRTANWDVVRLVKLISKGMPVIIEGPAPTPRPAPPALTKTDPKPAAPAPPLETPPESKRRFLFWKK